MFFFFQAEDGIRDLIVTGVQTCALPISLVGAAKGYRVKLVMPGNVSSERKALVTAYGADIVYSEAGEGSDGAILMVRELVGLDPDKYFYPDQYSNPANPRAHYEGTAVEILAQTSGRITHFIAGL